MQGYNEVWQQGSKPGDEPIERVPVTVKEVPKVKDVDLDILHDIVNPNMTLADVVEALQIIVRNMDAVLYYSEVVEHTSRGKLKDWLSNIFNWR